MNSPEVGYEGVAAKPCSTCRKRKVRCDKLRPCSNCVRSKILCTYESSEGGNLGKDGSHGASASAFAGDGELRERLARLEKMFAEMMVGGDKTGQSSVRAGQNITNQALNDPAIHPVISDLQGQGRLQPHSDTQPGGRSIYSTTTSPVGQVIFQEGEGAYFNADFWWPGLITEIEDLRRIFDTSNPGAEASQSQWVSSSLLGVPSVFSTTDLGPLRPSLHQCNALCKVFFQSINPFVRVLHQSLFAKELDQYRRGTYIFPQVFEALLFVIYALAINIMRPDTVKQVFSTSKDNLLSQYHYAAKVSLTKIQFFKTEKINGIAAVIHYVTFLFQQNLHKDAVSLFGIAVRQAQTMGLHRDPAHFPFSPWVSELRRRLWNQICHLDALAISSYGATSCLPATTDTRPPHNANDRDWHASRFAKPSSIPTETAGFKDMTFVVIQREISDTVRALSSLESKDFDGKEKLLDEIESNLTRTYFSSVDTSDASQRITSASAGIRLSSLRLAVRYRQTETGKLELPSPERQQVFVDAIELLEAYEYQSNNFEYQSWEWVFSSHIPWLAIAILITELPHSSSQQEADRAHLQIDRAFALYSAPAPVSQTPMWKMLVQLRHHVQNDPAQHQAPTTTPDTYAPSAAIFADDLMLDFASGGIATDGSSNIYDDQLVMQDMQDLPW